MFSLEELFSKRNMRQAFQEFGKKSKYIGMDRLLPSELEEFWQANASSVLALIKKEKYIPEMVQQRQLLKKSGGFRYIIQYASLDCIILRLLAQKLNRYLDSMFKDKSFAYRQGKGVMAAVMQAVEYLNENGGILVEIDLYQYFEKVPLFKLMQLLEEKIKDRRVLSLLKSYLYCQYSFQGKIFDKTEGLFQGSAISPVLSNLYLHKLDVYMEESAYHWLRFADNIYIFCNTREEAEGIFQDITDRLGREFLLPVNQKKSGIFKALGRRILGYDFLLKEGKVICQKHQYIPLNYYPHWQRSPLRFANQQYYIVEGGILSQKDYSLLFENEENRHCLPIETIHQIDIFSDVVISPKVLSLLAQKRIPIIIHNQIGQIQSYILPETMRSRAPVVLAQSRLYLDDERRLEFARYFEIAHLHNLRANVRYYRKKKSCQELEVLEENLSLCLTEVKEKKSVEDLMLLEARARQMYYSIFNIVINQEGFSFLKRTKRPPKDPLNTLISFCNTVLYSQVLKIIWQKGLDPQFSVLHASNNRPYSLQLDFADYWKPIIVDRVIFSLINRHQIHEKEHFESLETGAVLLNAAGKRLVLQEMEEKLHTKLVVKGDSYSYYQLIERDVTQFKKLIMDNSHFRRFKPYKYY